MSQSIINLSNLTWLDLSDNPLETPPIELAYQGIEGIRAYFRQLEEEGKDYIYEAKLLIVGEGGAGKTTLAKKIQDHNYQLDSNEKSTEGIDITKWSFPLDNEREFKVNIWDFGGQEIYHATHQFFLTKRSLYALVADARKEDTDFYYWLNVVELLSNNSPLLIVKNEKGDRRIEIDENSLRGRFSNLSESLATNLKDNRGLNAILKSIQYHITELPHVGSALPKTWKRVRETLEQDERNYISLEEYLNICETNGFTRIEDKLQLSGYLHDLGVCLHFQDSPLLKNTVILKPEWGTDAVYKVLDDTQVINNLGRFTTQNLDNIWSEEQYQFKQAELLELMMRFKLCYKIPGSKDTYIAPQLLTKTKPSYNWVKNDNLILRYTYEFMPKGIITQLIVAMHQHIYQQKYVWRSGVILELDETRAEVIEYYDKRELKIRVAGIRKKDLLTIITHELDKIHNSYQRLKYRKLIPCNCSECNNQQEPYFHPFDVLQKAKEQGIEKVQCQKSFEMVDVLKLIDDVILPAYKPVIPPKNSIEPKNSMNYQYFQILVDINNNIRASSENGENSGKLSLEMNDIELAIELIESNKTNDKLIKNLGKKLYQALFPNKINALFHSTIAGAATKKVRLRLIFKSPELASLPWEFLYYEDTKTFLSNNTQTVLSRYIDVPLPKRDIKSANLPLKVLVVISSPSNLASLDAANEENLIRKALAKNIEAGQIELDILHEATIKNINQKLREKSYNVFHFIGHGDFKDNKGVICLVDEDGKARNMDDESFASFFLGNNHLGLVILNSCQGATVSSNEAFKGTAPNLVQKGIPAVIAMQYSIWDTTAKIFADEFYRTLALGYPVDAAIQTTRNAISMEVGLDKRDFATPVLYMRAKDGIILQGF